MVACIFAVALTQECPSFQPPFTLACYQSIWKQVGCTEHGTMYPISLAAIPSGIKNALYVKLFDAFFQGLSFYHLYLVLHVLSKVAYLKRALVVSILVYQLVS